MKKVFLLILIIAILIAFTLKFGSSFIVVTVSIEGVEYPEELEVYVCEEKLDLNLGKMFFEIDCKKESSVKVFYKTNLLGSCGYFDGGKYEAKVNINGLAFDENNCEVNKVN